MPQKIDDKSLNEILKARKQLLVPIVPELIEATKNLGKGEIEVPKEITEIEAMIFSRGKLNAQFFRGIRRDYVVPFWVEKMLNPESEGVISLGHSSWFINSNYRNWVAFGGIDCFSEGTVTKKGLVVPLIDGYGLLSGAIIDKQPLYLTRDGKSKQELHKNHQPIIINKWVVNNKQYKQTVYGGKSGKSEVGVLCLEKMGTDKNSNLVLSIRPFNQEGVSLIKRIEYRPKDHAILINKELAFRIMNLPEKVACANYHYEKDSAIKVLELATEYNSQEVIEISCEVGLANMTFIFPKNQEKIEVYFRMTKEALEAPPVLDKISSNWTEKLSLGLSLKTGNAEVDRLYKASLANLLLLVDPGTITPGPTEYHRFWCRDAAFLINALDKTGYHNYAREALQQFINRQRNDGFYYSHEGEYDSNGEGIWVLSEHAKFTRDTFWLENVYNSIEKAASWLIRTRKLEKTNIPEGKGITIRGLLPPGYSAEHLGPCDYFYWDNFWGVAGLREAAYCAKLLQKDKANEFQGEYGQYLLDLFASTKAAFDKHGFLPVGPFRGCDSAMIANLCAYHPTKILDGENEMLRQTADTIYQKFTRNGGFFHEVAWNCFGTYLTMHLAQVYHDANDQNKVSEILDWLVKNKTCLMGWAEGISPQTMQGGMGDSPHGWASADWIHLLRNLFVTETLDGSVKLLSGYPVVYLKKGISAKGLKTYFGDLDYTAKLVKKTLNLKIINNLNVRTLKIITPMSASKILVDKGEAMITNDKCVEISKNAKNISIEME